MSHFSQVLSHRFNAGGKSSDHRKALRKKIGANGWIRIGEFALRPCKVINLSDTGVHISVDAAHTIPKTFSLLMSRHARAGRPAQIRWRRGTDIGAEFL
jgi:hypothetical protein